MKRNIDRICDLEQELGRWRKKAADQGRELRAAQEALEEARAGNRQTQEAVDAVLTAVALEYGTAAKDPDTGTAIGWRLSVPAFDAAELRERYEIHARRDEAAGGYVLGAARREKE